jgi:hypothetical protein
MDKTKSNGQVGHAVPAESVVAKPPSPVPVPKPDPYEEVLKAAKRVGQVKYLEGYRRAVTVIARGVGQLDAEAKTKLGKTLDQLEEEVHQAEVATQ